MVSRFDVYLVNLDPEPSVDPKNTRPAVIISPDELNRNVDTAIIAPLASVRARYPTRVAVNFLNGERHVVLDQIRTVDKERLVKKIGRVEGKAVGDLLERLAELFSE